MGGEALDTVLIDRLIDILDEESSLYNGILKLSKNKTDAVVEGKVSELESITKLEQATIIKLGRLEDEREKLVDKLAAQLNLRPSDITISGLEELLSKERSEKLKGCYNRLSKLITELREANDLNSKLIRNSLDYIDFSINVLTNAGLSAGNYGSSGQADNGKKRNFFDMKL